MSSRKHSEKKYSLKKKLDRPEQYPTDQKSLFDQFKSHQNVDPIPMEDVKLEEREEKEKHETKKDSSSEQK